MKKTSLSAFAKPYFKFAFSATILFAFISSSVNAQLAFFPLAKANATANNSTLQGQAQVSLTNPNVVTGTLADGANLQQDSYNASGHRIKPNNSNWGGIPADGWHFDIPIKPAATPTPGFDMHIDGIKLDITYADFDVTGSKMTIAPYFQVNGAGPWLPIGTAQTTGGTGYTGTLNFGPVNETFYSGKNYVIRFYVSSNDLSDDGHNDEIRIMNLVFSGTVYQPPAKPVTVQTLTGVATGKYTATATGLFDYNGTLFYQVKQWGMIWSTDATGINTLDTNAATKTADTSGATGNINAAITGLSAATKYYVKAYIVTQLGIQYGVVRSFTTDAATVPTVTTNPITNVLSNKATGGGAIPDSGGLRITAKGVVWGLTNGATITSNAGIITAGSDYTSFTDVMKILKASTNYCYRAFATNSLGTSYGNNVCFTTSAAVPVLNATPTTIDFGEIFLGSNAIVTSYILTGSSLSPASGTITITIATGSGFKISTNSSTGFATSITVPYTGGKISNTPIFVQFPANTFGTYSATITHSGGGASGANTDDVTLKGTVVQSPEEVSNKGTDFYLGFGYEEKMSRKAGEQTECRLSVYVTNPGSQPVKVHCDLTSGGYAQVTTIPAFGSYAFSGFPMGDPNNNTNGGNFPDTRLYSTGISNKSLHVYTEQNIPVAVHMHSYTNGNSAAGSIVFPTNTWNSSYTVQAFGGTSNNSNPNSFFFVIANEDNTVVTFTPTQPILDATGASLFNQNLTTAANTLYAANGTYTVTLNKGQVFNAMGGFSPAGNGLDLSGTKISTICDKKITVFGGNGRCLVQGLTCASNSGSDHLIQQMFPSVAWGTKYLTSPTANTAPNYYRIYFQDPASIVKVNGATLTAANLISVNGTPIYYQYQSAVPISITSDKPINVSQFMLTPACTLNSGIDAGPEMIILSPVEQAISNVVFFSPTSGKSLIDGAGAYTSYMNVIIPTSKAGSFKLDGVVPAAGSFKPHPQDAGYSYASLPVASQTKHSLTADTGFVAISYGYGNGESYGFNAGTAVKNLSSYKFSVNPLGGDSSSTIIRTCVRTPVTLKIGFPHLPSQVDKIVWEPNDPRVSPNTVMNGAISAGKAVYEGTKIIDGRTFYIYSSPVKYVFGENGLYRIKATAFGNFLSDCPGEDRQIILVNVGQDNLNLQADPKCNDPKVNFTADTIPMIGTNILSWKWEFGDAQTSTTSPLTPQLHDYGTSTQTAYKVKLTTLNSVGCYSSDSLDIDFGGGLEAKFTISKDAVCTNEPVTFTDGSSGSGTSGSPNDWKWDFSDGKTSNLQSPPVQSYTAPGIKTISLTVSTPIGCVKTFKDTVTVEATPVAVINANPTNVCMSDSAAYKDASTIAVGTITDWLWSFDDGTTSTLKDPKHKWLTVGSHTVTLTVKSTGGCTSNTATHTISVNPLPVSGFKYDLNCTTRTLTVTDTSNANGGTVTAWAWDFGVPGATSTLAGPSYVYTASGTYTVKLAVTTSNGCKSDTTSKTITIAASPVTDFTLPGNTCLPGASPAFTNTTTISDGTIALVTYSWNFGDNTGDQAGLGRNPTHVFPATGPYTVSLTATSNNGCTNTKTKSYTTLFAPPVAKISPVAEVCVGSAIIFASSSSSASGSTVTGWNWNFNNEGNSAIQGPTYTYSAAGSKITILSVTSAAGCTSKPDTITTNINALPTADFSDTINCTSRSIGFTDLSVANAGIVNKWNWDFGTVPVATSTSQNPTQVFPNEGNFTISLSVKTDKGCSSASPVTKIINIAARPVTDFTLPGNTCLPGANASFVNTTAISDGSLGSVVYGWDFGDTTGIVSSPASPTHPYLYTGNHMVTLTATSSNGCMKSVSKLYDKVFAQPVAVITAPAGVCLGNAATFTSTSSTAPASTVTGWQWGFGDSGPGGAGSSTQQNAVYTYAGSGPRTVTLTVTSAAGCSSAETTQAIDVNLSPIAAFIYSAVRCKDSVIAFNDASVSNATGGITEWTWTYGDGGTLTQTALAPATHAFAGAQSYPVSLSVKNANGCVSSPAFTTPVIINPNPISKFTVSDICVPAGGPAQFTQTATVSTGSVVSWLWNFGDTANTTSTLSNPTFNYSIGAAYLVTLKATSDSGCIATITDSVNAYSTPTPLFSVAGVTTLCSNLPVEITDSSKVTGYGNLDKVELYWNYVNAPSAKETFNAPTANSAYTHEFDKFGTPATKTFRILVRAYNGGCTADYFQDVNLLASPKVQFARPAPVCQEAPSFDLSGVSEIYSLPGSGAFSGPGIITSPAFSPSRAGFGTHTIRYTYTTTTGCKDYAEDSIVVNPTPVISFANRTIINSLEGDVLTLAPTITNGATYLWTGPYLHNLTSATPSGIPLQDAEYHLIVKSDKLCVGTKDIKVRVVRTYIVPNTFTPNGDGNHEFWDVENLSYYPDVRVRVFSRTGQMVFESYGYNTPWDGKYKGSDLPFGTYYYVIETGGGRKPRTGYVTIIR
jgi:gliding motility-associated-like protein